jgi:predicted ATP-dependent endonuclease of OLD family
MRIKKVRIKNYRSIRSEAVIDFDQHTTILGPNNSGKTNFLKAVYLFFEAGRNNTYSIKDDLPFGLTGEQTSITITFEKNRELDFHLLKKYDEITELLEEGKSKNSTILTLYLSFSLNGKPIYRFFTNEKIKPERREDHKRLQEELITEFLENFSCKYVPSEKSAAKLYEDFFVPHLQLYVGDLLKDQEKKVTTALATVSDDIIGVLSKAGLSNIRCEFDLPEKSFRTALSKFDFFIDDGEKTQFARKGSGIQAATTLACFKWISRRELKSNKDVIWLIEEPESYLHPALTDSCKKILLDLSSLSDVFATTHAIGFIPPNHEKVLQTNHSKENGTTFSNFRSYAEATQSIRAALGIRFSDYYSLTEFNVFVEGKTDKLIIEHLLNIIKPKGVSNKLESLRNASVIDFTGTSSLKDFLKSTYAFMSKERAIVTVFDGL